MDLHATIDVTPRSTVSTLQFPSDVANTIINSILIALTVANINSVISKLVHLTNKDTFRYDSFLRVFIFHNSDDPALLFSWLRQAYLGRKDPLRSKYRVTKRRLFAPIVARVLILIGTIGSIAITIPSEKSLKGCDQRDWYLSLRRRQFIAPTTSMRGPSAPVCTEIPMKSNLGSVRTRINYCSVPVNAELRSLDRSAILVQYFPETGVLYSGVASTNDAIADGVFVLQANEAYVEWVDAQNINYRSSIVGWQWEEHATVVLDAIRSIVPNCERVGERQEDPGGISIIPVSCNFNAVEVSQTADAYIRNSLRWTPTGRVMDRILVNQNFQKVRYCPIDISVSRPIVNMVPLAALLVMLFTVNLAVGFTTSERGEVFEQIFGLVKEVLGFDCTSSAIERSDEIDGVQVAEVRKWVCSGGLNYHEGILKGDGCDELREFPKDAIVTRCRYANGSGRRVVNVGEGGIKAGKKV